MVTKWKFIAARTSVKFVSVLLILTLFFIILNRLNECVLRQGDTRVSPGIVFYNLPDSRVFYDNHMRYVYENAATAARYMSEESIRAGEHIKWETSTYEHWNQGEIYLSNEYSLRSTSGNYHYGALDEDGDTPEKRAELEQNAIAQQLAEFTRALDTLNGNRGDTYVTEGFLYYIANSGGTIYSNVAAVSQNAEAFKSLPVFYLKNESGLIEASHTSMYPYNSPPDYADYSTGSAIIYLGYDSSIVDLRMGEYMNAKNAYVLDFTIAAIAAALILLLLAVLFTGAGRGAEDGSVHFTVLDRIYLDLGLAMLLGWLLLTAVAFFDGFYDTVWFYSNNTAMNLTLAAVSIALVLPSLLWLLNFAKRVKAGRFWRYTLLFALPCASLNSVKSLWAGFRLNLKIALITLASLIIMLFCAATGTTHDGAFILFPILILTAAVGFLLQRYARRIYKLEQGALEASRGDYNTAISVGRGELGRIAESINNISAGINTAVEQRMKSERLKTELITNVSHDIRTPLTSIITYTDLLKNEGLDCENAPEYLDVLIQKSQRLKTLTDELFEAAKAATGNIDVHITELDLMALINQVLGELDSAIAASGLDLRIKLPERMMVKADGKLMWRVMENLLSNVFKYSLKNSRVYLGAERDGVFIRVDLKNISATELNVEPSELTERFKRGDDSRTDGGSGLGLSIVQSFINAQGGRFALSIDGDLFKASVFLPSAE